MKTKAYHNTTDLEGKALETATKKAKSQEEAIFEIFKNNPWQTFTPFQIQARMANKFVPITSVRRAISNLTRKDKIVKTDIQRKGEYGAVNYTWQLRQTDPQLKLDL